MKKIYCKDCRHGKINTFFEEGECIHPDCFQDKEYDTPLERKKVKGVRKFHYDCQYLNKYNNCDYFEPHKTFKETIVGWKNWIFKGGFKKFYFGEK